MRRRCNFAPDITAEHVAGVLRIVRDRALHEMERDAE
jgi:hypothetical protein